MSAEEFLEKASKVSIIVIGDLIVDHYIFGTVDRISPEAPVPVLKMTGEKSTEGGAKNVFANIKGLGVPAIFFHSNFPVIKTRVMSDNHHMLRIDEEELNATYTEYHEVVWMNEFESQIKHTDCVVLSDYHKGTLSFSVSQEIIRLCMERKTPVIVDAKRDWFKFAGATVLKCNEKELGNTSPYALLQDYGFRWVIKTCGSRGIRFYGHDLSGGVDGVNTNISDVCGAGDTVTAILAICLAIGFQDIEPSVTLANIAAAEVCRHPGVYPITKEDFIRVVNEYHANTD